MTIVKLNANRYAHALHGRGIYGKYSKIRTRHGYGIVDSLGKDASKYLLSGLGSSTGKFYGKQLGKLIGEKSGSNLVGSIAKAGLSSLGGLAGDKLGSFVGHHLGNTVFGSDKKKKGEQKVSLSQLLDNARKSITGKGISLPGAGLNLPGRGMEGSGIMLNY